jgi:histone H3/H4
MLPDKADEPTESLKKGVLIHASAVNVLGRALLFLGHSNAGKTTISKLLEDYYPVLADDKVWISQQDNGTWIVQDATLSARRAHLNASKFEKEQYPLLAVARIFQANAAEIVSISAKETCKFLMDAIFEIKLQRSITLCYKKKEWFVMAADISRNTRGFVLTFPRNKNIIHLINHALENEISELRLELGG